MNTSDSLNELRDLIDGMKGHNYAFPDCIKYIFECLNVYGSIDFWDIAALCGDTVAHVYNKNESTQCEYCVSGYLAGEEYIAVILNTLGCTFEYINAAKIRADKDLYKAKIASFIKKGVPVLAVTNLRDIPEWESDVGTHALVVGYSNNGDTLKLQVCDKTTVNYDLGGDVKLDLVFIDSVNELTAEQIAVETVKKIPLWLTMPEHDGKYFGAAACHAWAADIRKRRFAAKTDYWGNFAVYVVNIATNGGGLQSVFFKLASFGDKYNQAEAIGEKIQKLCPTENPRGGTNMLWQAMEQKGAGLDCAKLEEVMHDADKSAEVADLLEAYANNLDKAVEIIIKYVSSL